MGRLTYGMMQSLDGYIADTAGEITLPVPNAELHQHFNDLLRATAMSVYGRRMWETMRYWGEPDAERDAVAVEFAELWQQTPKVVVSTTLTETPPGVRLVRDNPVDAVRALKDEVEGDLEVSGAGLAAVLGEAGLIDEYLMYFQPVVLGAGRPYFAEGFRPNLRLLGTERLPQDVVLVRCAPA